MNTQLRKIQDRMAGNFIMRLLTCTLLLLGEMQLPPSNQNDHRKPYLQCSNLLGGCLETGVCFTQYSKLKLKSS